jgi:hypothetical protein
MFIQNYLITKKSSTLVLSLRLNSKQRSPISLQLWSNDITQAYRTCFLILNLRKAQTGGFLLVFKNDYYCNSTTVPGSVDLYWCVLSRQHRKPVFWIRIVSIRIRIQHLRSIWFRIQHFMVNADPDLCREGFIFLPCNN